MKLRRSIPVLAVSMVLLAANETRAGDLKNLLPNLFGPGGITLQLVEQPIGISHLRLYQITGYFCNTTVNCGWRVEIKHRSASLGTRQQRLATHG
jgi:hypothetical protein